MRQDGLIGVTALGLMLAAGGASAQQITMLPTLGGAWSYANDINDAGVAVGGAYLPGDTEAHAVKWVDGVATDLGAITGNSEAWGINSAGQIVGQSDAGSWGTAMLWENGSWTDLGADMNAQGNSVAWDINDSGLVVGQAPINPGFAKGFVWEGPGTGRTEGTIFQGGANKGVNAAGVLVGHGFFFGDPDMAMMASPDGRGGWDEFEIGPSGYNFSIATAVSDAGTMVGFATDGGSFWNAVIFTGDPRDPIVPLGTLPRLEMSEAYDVNESGVIVGSAWDDDFVLESRAWAYFDGAMHDLNDYLEHGQTEWDVLLSAQAVNENGDIAGYGLTPSGEVRGFVMRGVVTGPCEADVNGDGVVDPLDLLAFLNLWVPRDPEADWNGDGVVNTLDVVEFLRSWVSCR